MLRKALGSALAFLAFGCAAFFVMAVSDLVTGGSPETGAGVLAGLAVFFAGLTVGTGFGGWRFLTTKGPTARSAETAAVERLRGTAGVDIALEARVLAHAARHEGRVTIAEVAVACATSLGQAERALDGLTQRGHADLNVTADGERVYVLKGFLSDAEKQQALDVVAATRAL